MAKGILDLCENEEALKKVKKRKLKEIEKISSSSDESGPEIPLTVEGRDLGIKQEVGLGQERIENGIHNSEASSKKARDLQAHSPKVSGSTGKLAQSLGQPICDDGKFEMRSPRSKYDLRLPIPEASPPRTRSSNQMVSTRSQKKLPNSVPNRTTLCSLCKKEDASEGLLKLCTRNHYTHAECLRKKIDSLNMQLFHPGYCLAKSCGCVFLPDAILKISREKDNPLIHFADIDNRKIKK